jgi:hypothetical protein
MPQIVLAVLYTLLAVFAMVAVACLCYAAYRVVLAVDEFTKTVDRSSQIVIQIGTLKEVLESVPKLVEGLIRVSQVQVSELQKLAESVDKFRETLLGGGDRQSPGRESDYTNYSDEVASERATQIAEMMGHGLSPAQAAARIDNADMWKKFVELR